MACIVAALVRAAVSCAPMRLRIPCIAATIQRFEFSYELSDKMPKRYLEMAAPNPARIDEMVFHDMIRTGELLKRRQTTSHGGAGVTLEPATA